MQVCWIEANPLATFTRLFDHYNSLTNLSLLDCNSDVVSISAALATLPHLNTLTLFVDLFNEPNVELAPVDGEQVHALAGVKTAYLHLSFRKVNLYSAHYISKIIDIFVVSFS